MGTDYTTHLGPYVECRTGKVEKTLTKKACTNKKCETYGKERFSPFCDKCGNKIGDFSYTEKGNAIDPYDVMYEMKESLTVPGGDYIHHWFKKNSADLFVSNKYRKDKKARPFSFDPTSEVDVVEITLNLMAEELTEFQNQFQKEISILRKHYGLENVTVKWGLINTIH